MVGSIWYVISERLWCTPRHFIFSPDYCMRAIYSDMWSNTRKRTTSITALISIVFCFKVEVVNVESQAIKIESVKVYSTRVASWFCTSIQLSRRGLVVGFRGNVLDWTWEVSIWEPFGCSVLLGEEGEDISHSYWGAGRSRSHIQNRMEGLLSSSNWSLIIRAVGFQRELSSYLSWICNRWIFLIAS